MHRTQEVLPITPVILTFNEEPNIARTLEALRWAHRVVVLDSGSTDKTESIAQSYPNVTWHTRTFDCHGAQWTYAVKETGIDTNWVLALDADMVVPPAFVEELKQHFFAEKYCGGIVRFKYFTGGRKLLGSLYPPDLRVFQPDKVCIVQVGHSQRFSIEGENYRFHTHVFHDDRKPLNGWVKAQLNYALLEHRRMATDNPTGIKYSLRKLGLFPVVAAIVGYVRAGGPLRGRAAIQYAYERLTFESLVALQLFRDRAYGLDTSAGRTKLEENSVNR